MRVAVFFPSILLEKDGFSLPDVKSSPLFPLFLFCVTTQGAWLSYLAPSPPNNTLNVFIVSLKNASSNSSSPQPNSANPPKAFQLMREAAFDIDPGQYQWSPDSRFVLYLFDRDPKVGDRYRLWKKEISKPNEEAVDLLPEFSSTKRSSSTSSGGDKSSSDGDKSSSDGVSPSPPSNRTLPPGLMGDNLHIGQFFLSEKVPVRREGERERREDGGREERESERASEK